MELKCSTTAAKKMWNIVKLAFFMMRNGLVPKHKLMLDISLAMKRGKLLGKSLGTLMFRHLHHHRSSSSTTTATPDGHVYGPDEYEFSCSNTPVPVLFAAHSKRKHTYFPCISAPPVDEQDKIPKSVMTTMLPRIEHSPQCAYSLSGLAPGERRSTPIPSPFSARVSNCSRAGEGEGSSTGEVDHEAEEFIRRFYQQLQLQLGLLEDQEKENHKMSARGI